MKLKDTQRTSANVLTVLETLSECVTVIVIIIVCSNTESENQQVQRESSSIVEDSLSVSVPTDGFVFVEVATRTTSDQQNGRDRMLTD